MDCGTVDCGLWLFCSDMKEGCPNPTWMVSKEDASKPSTSALAFSTSTVTLCDRDRCWPQIIMKALNKITPIWDVIKRTSSSGTPSFGSKRKSRSRKNATITGEKSYVWHILLKMHLLMTVPFLDIFLALIYRPEWSQCIH